MAAGSGSRDLWVAMSGGVGGAKLALGLAKILPADELLIVANTGDDFDHCDYLICPDIDTLIYTLAGIANPDTGWGRREETWHFMDQLRRRAPDKAWFQIGDKDRQTHELRRQLLAQGDSLTEVTAELCRHYGVDATILPMSDDPVRTHLLVDVAGSREWMAFQEYFVKHRCEPAVSEIHYRGSDEAAPQPKLLDVLASGRVRGLVICPSNPFLSIAPILSVPGLVSAIDAAQVPVIAVSPVVGGQALKGPTAKIMAELDMAVDVVSVARYYQGLVHGLVIDHGDSQGAEDLAEAGVRVLVTNTVMVTMEDRQTLAEEVLAFCAEW